MNIVLSVILFILVIGLLIFIHELGHFLVAKRNGIGVVEFSIGMGPLLHSWTSKGTRFSLRWLPFGGYCMLLGSETYFDDEADETVSDDAHAYKNKPVWQRIAVTVAGPLFNFILAFLLGVLLTAMIGAQTSDLGTVYADYPAGRAGLQAGDRIVRLGNENIHLFKEISLYISLHQGEVLDVTYERDGVRHTTQLTPEYDEEYGSWLIGIGSAARLSNMSFPQILQYGAYEFGYGVSAVFKSLGLMVTGRASINDLSGPVGIAGQVNTIVSEVQKDTEGESIFVTAFWILVNMINFAIIISANLGVLNLLPVPGLDGGKLLLLVIEAIRGKPLNKKVEGIVMIVGIVLLLGLMAVVLVNDIRKVFFV
ncbi:MAG: site-2 protease family protein [Lachnospiraceae bacterium]|nr:site-2 protease family protein [Lachnospiraceae bacterium]MBP5255107.1 site-2 protease family protein [Lachnospiraceae bacterium]